MTTRTKCSRAIRAAFASGAPVRCEYCDRELVAWKHGPNMATGDHRIPRSMGGPDSYDNIAIVCYQCNQLKGPLTLDEFMSLRRDCKALKEARWVRQRELLGQPTSRQEFNEGLMERRRVRVEKLRHRMKEPDPDCEWCSGDGLVPNGNICRCSITPLSA